MGNDSTVTLAMFAAALSNVIVWGLSAFEMLPPLPEGAGATIEVLLLGVMLFFAPAAWGRGRFRE